jgi:endonuclease/exonuclease/phosphatase family metal-dependent hydrolase
MSDKNIDLIAFNETRLDLNISDGLIHIYRYEVVRKDRSGNGRWVICIYLRSSINYKIRSDQIPPEFEAVCLEITKPQSRPFIVITKYLLLLTAEFFDHLEKLIKQIDDENKEMYILGDLNCNLLQEKPLFNIPTKNYCRLIIRIISINPIRGVGSIKRLGGGTGF